MTFWLVAQCLNQLRHRMPLDHTESTVKIGVQGFGNAILN